MTRKISNYNECAYVKRTKVKKLGIFTIVLFLISVGLVISFADLISSRLTGGGSLFIGGKIKISSFNVYAIEIGSFSEYSQAQNLATSIKNKGGAGYILQSGDYHIFLSMYESLADAEQVKGNLQRDSLSVKIYNINMPTIDIKYRGEERLLTNALNEFKKLYRKIYELSIAYDSNEMTKIKVVANIEGYIEEIKGICDDLENEIDYQATAALISVKTSLEKVIVSMKEIVKKNNDGMLFNSAIKYGYFEIMFEYLALAREI